MLLSSSPSNHTQDPLQPESSHTQQTYPSLRMRDLKSNLWVRPTSCHDLTALLPLAVVAGLNRDTYLATRTWSAPFLQRNYAPSSQRSLKYRLSYMVIKVRHPKSVPGFQPMSCSHSSMPNRRPTTSKVAEAGVHESDNTLLRRDISGARLIRPRLQAIPRTLRGHAIRHLRQVRGSHVSGRLSSRGYTKSTWLCSSLRRCSPVFPEHRNLNEFVSTSLRLVCYTT